VSERRRGRIVGLVGRLGWRRVSLRSRIALISAIAVAVAVVAVSAVVFFVVATQLRQQADRELTADAHAVAERLGHSSNGGSDPDHDHDLGPLVQALDGSGRPVLAAGVPAPLPVTSAALAVVRGERGATFENVHIGGQEYRMLTRSAENNGGAVQVAVSTAGVEGPLVRIGLVLVMVSACGVAVATVLGFLVARTGLAPVHRLTGAVEHVAATNDLSSRITVNGRESIRAARRKLRYESWHLLHLYAYLGVGLAMPHQLWTDAEFVDSPAARAYWWSAYLVCAGSILVFRLGLPLWRSHRHRLRVRQVRWETPGVFSVYISGRDLHRLPAQAGQFLNWRFLTGTGWTRAHPYSLSAAPRGDLLRITVRASGDDADRVARARRGTRVLVEGPYGRLTGAVRGRRQILLLGAGIGITPLRALLEELPFQPGEAALVYRANGPNDFALRSELDAIARRRGALVHYLAGPPPTRPSWLPNGLAQMSDRDAILQIAPDVTDRDVYLCGPAPWMAAVRTALRDARVPKKQIHSEDFAW
jgi:ferredoxin-NADP reductase